MSYKCLTFLKFVLPSLYIIKSHTFSIHIVSINKLQIIHGYNLHLYALSNEKYWFWKNKKASFVFVARIFHNVTEADFKSTMIITQRNVEHTFFRSILNLPSRRPSFPGSPDQLGGPLWTLAPSDCIRCAPFSRLAVCRAEVCVLLFR